LPQKPKKIPIEVADIDEIYSFGKCLTFHQLDEPGIVYERWQYNGIEYGIERKYSEGESIVVTAEDIKDANFCAEIYQPNYIKLLDGAYHGENLRAVDCFKDKKIAMAWAKSTAKDDEKWRIRNRRTDKIVASLTGAVWRWDD